MVRPIPAKNSLVMSDGLANVVSGIGTGADKNTFNRYAQTTVISQGEVEAAYRTSGLVRKVHDLPPFDMVRAWRDWQADGAIIEKIEAEEKRLQLKTKVLRAKKWARLYGGAALILGCPKAGDADKELTPEQITEGRLEYVHVLSRHQITITDINRDVSSPYFGQPTTYTLAGGGATANIHPSRVIPFIDQEIPAGAMGEGADTFWGDPLMQSIRDNVVNADLTQAGIAAMVNEAKIDTLSIPRLTELVATTAGETQMMRRLSVANLAKSVLNTRVIDKEETWETRELSFTGLPDVLKLFLQIVAGVCDIPATRLLGTSPDGMNATGKSDLDNYFMMIAARQELELRPALETLDAFLLRSALGSVPKDVYWEFAPLQASDPVQLATIEKTRADTVKVYVDTGLIPDTALAKATQNSMTESGQWPGLETALAEAEAAGDIADILEEPAEDPSAMTTGPDGKPLAPEQPPKVEAITDAEPRTLYVSRKVLNAAEIIAWAKGQGFKTTTPADDLHVTVAYSRAPVDWMKVEEAWGGDKTGEITIAPGGPRVVEKLGDKGAVVLMFGSWELTYRHGVIRQAGASWDYAEYQPHVTISYEAGDLDLEAVAPYRGKIVFGPEIFEELDEDWQSKLTEE